jgi:hypothetical protein
MTPCRVPFSCLIFPGQLDEPPRRGHRQDLVAGQRRSLSSGRRTRSSSAKEDPQVQSRFQGDQFLVGRAHGKVSTCKNYYLLKYLENYTEDITSWCDICVRVWDFNLIYKMLNVRSHDFQFSTVLSPK